MQTPSTPEKELERLNALKNLEILDTPPSDIFDDLTALAATICGTPIALITLLDENRQWFKSKIGIEATQTPREISFCGHAILQDNVFEVENALLDARFLDNPLVTGMPNIRFYAGMPIKTQDAHHLGTLCVIDTVPRTLTEAQKTALMQLSKQVMLQIEHRTALKTIINLNQTLYEKATFTQTLIDNIPATFGYWDQNQHCVYANQKYQSTLNLAPQAMLGKHYLEALPSFMTEQLHTHFVKTYSGEPQTTEMTRIDKNGTTQHALVHYSPHFDTQKNVLGVFALGMNVTALKNAQENLSLAQKALNSASEALLITDLNYQVVFLNDAYSLMIGYTKEEAIHLQPQLFRCPNQAQDFLMSIRSKIQTLGAWHGDVTIQNKFGNELIVLMTIDAIKDEKNVITNYVISMIDITEKEKIKTALATTNAMLQRTGEISNIGGWEYDFKNETILWSDQMYTIHEIDNFQIPDLHSAILFYKPEARDVVKNAVENCIKNGTPWDLELPFTTAKGRNIWVRTIGEMVKINGVDIKLAGTCQDITERKKQEQQRLANEVSLRNTLVREVHHRIKNNLQGVSGVLFNAATQLPQLQEPINAAILQLQSVAVIHGLQGKNVDTKIEFQELLLAIVENIQAIWQSTILFEKSAAWLPCYVSKNEAVPIALIMNELLTNAEKHKITNTQVQVNLAQSSNPFNIKINISNQSPIANPASNPTTHLSQRLQKDDNISNTGLQLIHALMPKNGAYLYFSEENGNFTYCFEVKFPVLEKV